ncbi:glycerol-3-phosphate dehydrogenase [Rhizobium sp. TRM95796]|uniref:glycerol-3-phosphate dehydrogenase n=1 Tax=Rhizobium sp. TRM95796 TaxID=2979862 RepID=UPI0021E87FBF|nr:glycerol-3-phosphate dehydrogenase [Rhizobium sp. TRM95796]MCV3766006.1 glycerol-3-phosphate dehydrogenase [Rhizobium sp. TRM95796]
MTADVIHDVFIAGGGINGCGIARDAVGRGYSVYLAEMKDLASGTSSWSTKLIHGGLRYLEHYEFRLVREALMEREVLWGMAPHIIWPLRFVLPLHKDMRPGWLIRIGLFLYDHIGGRKALPATRVLDLTRDPAGKPLKDRFRKAFEYSDCWVNDARLVALNARDAADRGATIRTRAKVVSARREGGLWAIVVEDVLTGARDTVKAKLFVNAAGPWVDKLLQNAAGSNTHNVRLVQGSHIVVKKKFADPRAYFFQNNDGRIFFAIPYEQDFTLIGTTDRDYKGDPADVKITDDEIDYLCAGASEYFKEPVTRADMVWSYSGVRPLYDDGASKAQEATRDYVLKAVGADGEPQMLNVFGGKITTYRKLAESMLEKIEAVLGAKGKPWTEGATLPGGDFDRNGFGGLVSRLRTEKPWLPGALAERLMRLYGTKAFVVVKSAGSLADLGRVFGGDLTEAEVNYLMDQEWAVDAEDVLWRRTKLGLTLDADSVTALEAYMQDRRSTRAAAQ